MNWTTNIWKPGSFILVCIQLSKEGNEYKAILVNKKTANDSSALQRFDSLGDVTKHYGKNKGYQIHITGSGVLTRSINFHSNYKEDLIVSGDPNSFYFTSFNDGQRVVSSFFRKDVLEDEIQLLEENKISLLNITSGDVPLFVLLGKEDIIKASYQIVLQAGMIGEFSRIEQPNLKRILWQGVGYDIDQLLVKALYKNLIEQPAHFESSFRNESETILSDFTAKRQFQILGVSTISIILLALVINHFYLNSLNQDIAQLESDLSAGNENLALLDRLEQEKIRKEQLVLNAGVTSSKFLAFYLDEIGSEVPKAITLKSLQVFPLTEKLKDKQKVEVDQHLIDLTGVTQNNEVLDDWIERMDRFAWVDGIELKNYLKNESGSADFKLEIRITN